MYVNMCALGSVHIALYIYIYIYINSETILLRLQLFQCVGVPHHTKLTGCIVAVRRGGDSSLDTHTYSAFDMLVGADPMSGWCRPWAAPCDCGPGVFVCAGICSAIRISGWWGVVALGCGAFHMGTGCMSFFPVCGAVPGR